MQVNSVSARDNADPGSTALSEEILPYSSASLHIRHEKTPTRLEGHPMYRRVLFITRKHQDKNIDDVSVSPSDSQSKAICSLLEGKGGKLLWQELSLQLNSAFEAGSRITDPHKWLADRNASPVNWSETGELYNKLFEQDASGSVTSDVLGRLFPSSPPTDGGKATGNGSRLSWRECMASNQP